MQALELFDVFLKPLNSLNIPYMITGAAAVIVYGEPRMTHDLDLVISIQQQHIQQIFKNFPDDSFYTPPEEVLRVEIARTQRGHFNIIHFDSGLRADIYLSGTDPLHQWAMKRRNTFIVTGETVWIAPPEYVIIRKLQYFREGRSQKHLNDIRNMLEVSETKINHETLAAFVKDYQLEKEWQQVKSRSQ